MARNDTKWSYKGKKGPRNWGFLCSEFEIALTGKSQSPICIDTNNVKQMDDAPPDLHYHQQNYITKRIGKTVHLFPVENNQHLIYQNQTYALQSFHAHIPSEHLLNGSKFPIEWHFVHENSCGEKLVLGVWMEIQENTPVQLEKLSKIFIEVFYVFESEREIVLNINEFLPAKKAFFTYSGSLTTPPTLEGITWLILKERNGIDFAHFARFEKTIGKTSRPPQPLNGRVVSFHDQH